MHTPVIFGHAGATNLLSALEKEPGKKILYFIGADAIDLKQSDGAIRRANLLPLVKGFALNGLVFNPRPRDLNLSELLPNVSWIVELENVSDNDSFTFMNDFLDRIQKKSIASAFKDCNTNRAERRDSGTVTLTINNNHWDRTQERS